ncbi:MAG: PaaI family thioesterase [Coriobacteriia bacterium]|nr:PaaI family thioesterase [Coriobacteriia bacterium]
MPDNEQHIKVDSAQSISRMCFVCGEDNRYGLHARFLNLADGRVACQFTAQNEHQGYPGRMHGGVISSVLDELIGRLLQVKDPTSFAVTLELSVKYRKPVPLGEELTAIAWTTNETARLLEGDAELYLADGSVAIQASAKYLKMAVERIAPEGLAEVDWFADRRPYPPEL